MALHLIDYNAIFIHIPKTGGTFVRHVICDVLKLRTEEVGYKHSHPDLIGKICLEGKTKFAFVRDPLEWYQSYWSMKKWHMDHKSYGDIYESDNLWHPTWRIDKYCWDDDFNQFVNNVELAYPGFVHHMFQLYTKWVGFIGQQKNLVNDLCFIFSQLGIKHDRSVFENSKVNGSDSNKPKAIYQSEGLYKLVEQNNPVLSTQLAP